MDMNKLSEASIKMYIAEMGYVIINGLNWLRIVSNVYWIFTLYYKNNVHWILNLQNLSKQCIMVTESPIQLSEKLQETEFFPSKPTFINK
jgi:hypothetical protein